ncbi:SGNH/GDSL hydrolase family protein [Xanthobacter sp. TB0139]
MCVAMDLGWKLAHGVLRVIMHAVVPLVCVLTALAVPPAWAEAVCPISARPQPVPKLEAARKALAEGRRVTILAIGSSSTAGVGASRQGSFPAQLAMHLSQALGPQAVTVMNAGVSGERGPATLRRLEAFLSQPHKPDLLIWQVGTNDYVFGGRADRLSDIVMAGLKIADAAGVPVILMNQQYYPLILNVPRYETFVAAVNDAAQMQGVSLLPRYSMMKAWSRRDPTGFGQLLSWDRFHMNEAGYACLAQLLSATILEALQGSGTSKKPAGLAIKPSVSRDSSSAYHGLY